jgi:uncharacterized protein (TIGR02594 family)
MNSDLILKAISQYGIEEIAEKVNDPNIIDYFKVSGHSWVKDDDTYSWCSAFVNWVARKCGYESTGTLLARDWLKVGIPVDKPEQGDIVVFWRVKKDSIYGHVGFYIGEVTSLGGRHIYVLGGNQSNMVKISTYPKDRILGYRRLRKV